MSLINGEHSNHNGEMLYGMEECPFGWLALLVGPMGLRRVSLQPDPQEALAGLGEEGETAREDAAATASAMAAFRAYFAGDMEALERVETDAGTAPPFFGAAWQACRSIPPGETRTYQWLAEAAGEQKAARAAGQAMAKNPLPLVIPCHRVIGSGGGLHGYGAGGTEVKARLLAMEREAVGAQMRGYQPSLSPIMTGD